MDAIFKALADDTRRNILDMLREKDGQTLSELETALAEFGLNMTRFGVMKHLKVLEAASLVVSRKQGRFKFHYLNAVPLQQVIDRWIEPFTQKKLARAALDLKAKLESKGAMSTSEQPDFILETYIKTTPEKLWAALTDGEISKNYYQGDAVVESTFEAGADYVYLSGEGNKMILGEIIEATPHTRLEMTFLPAFMDRPEVLSRNVYEIEQLASTCKLTIMHFGITPELEPVKGGWSRIAARLKTYLETGETLDLSEG